MPRFAPGTDSAAATYVEHFLVGILRRAAFPRNIVTRWCGSRAIHKDASIAQLVEHRSRKAGVIGSSPIAGSMIFRRLLSRRRFWYEPLSWIRTDEVAELGKAHERLCQRSARGAKRRSDPAQPRAALYGSVRRRVHSRVHSWAFCQGAPCISRGNEPADALRGGFPASGRIARENARLLPALPSWVHLRVHRRVLMCNKKWSE